MNKIVFGALATGILLVSVWVLIPKKPKIEIVNSEFKTVTNAYTGSLSEGYVWIKCNNLGESGLVNFTATLEYRYCEGISKTSLECRYLPTVYKIVKSKVMEVERNTHGFEIRIDMRDEVHRAMWRYSPKPIYMEMGNHTISVSYP